jgi:hypothetical protein
MYVMSNEINQIIESWDSSSSEERKEFLKELHKRYGIQRICLALSVATDCEIRNSRNYKENNFVLSE